MPVYRVGFTSYEDSSLSLYETFRKLTEEALQDIVFESAMAAYRAIPNDEDYRYSQLADIMTCDGFYQEMANRGMRLIEPDGEASVFGWHGLGASPIEKDDDDEDWLDKPHYWDQAHTPFDRRLFDALVAAKAKRVP